jgi:hypothetical protein
LEILLVSERLISAIGMETVAALESR